MKDKIKKLAKKGKVAQSKADAQIAKKSGVRRAFPEARMSWDQADKAATKTVQTFEKKAKSKKGFAA